MISIKYNGDGRITNKYNGERAGAWITMEDGGWPDADPDDDETPRYYYDEDNAEVYVEYEKKEDGDIEEYDNR